MSSVNSNILTPQLGFAAIPGLVDLPCYQLRFQNAAITVSLYGAQVLSYQPSPDQELLWVSSLARWQQGQAIRGGIPLCWPWFGKAAEPVQAAWSTQTASSQPSKAVSLPNHGLVRTTLWQLLASGSTPDFSWMTLQVSVNMPDKTHTSADTHVASDTNAQLSCTLQLEIRLSDRLELILRCDSLQLQQAAFHSYFQVGDCTQSRVSPLPTTYDDKVTQTTVTTSDTELQFAGEVDRIYHHTAQSLQLSRAPQQLPIVIQQHGHDASILWQPGTTRAAQMSDIDLTESHQFVCVETAALALEPAQLQLSQIIQLLR